MNRKGKLKNRVRSLKALREARGPVRGARDGVVFRAHRQALVQHQRELAAQLLARVAHPGQPSRSAA